MKRNIFVAILLAAAVAYSCTSVEEPITPSGEGSLFNPTATIENFVLDGPETKTLLEIDETTGANFKFTADDELGVFPLNPIGQQFRFTVKNIDDETVTFSCTGWALDGNQTYSAYYPFNTAAYLDQDVVAAMPFDYTTQRQVAKDVFDISQTDYLSAAAVQPASSNSCHFTMSHVGALVVFDVTLTGEGSALYTGLTLGNDMYDFALTGDLNLTQSPATLSADEQGKEITLALGKGNKGLRLEAGQTHRFCMMVPPTNLKEYVDMGLNATVTLTLTDKNGDEYSATIPAKNFQAGKAYRIEATIAAAADDPAVPTNLSANGTANCYIVDVDDVNEGGYYFDCTVAGNGQEVNMAAKAFNTHPNVWPQVNGQYSASLPVLHASDIRVTLNQNNCISNVTIDPTAGTIFFKASGAKGNAKILVMDAANDDPAWVWHIWCTDQPTTVHYNSLHWTGWQYEVMDRNLGAIKAQFDDPTNANNNPDEICGFYYQFGNPTGWTWAEYSNTVADYWRMVDGIAGAEKLHRPVYGGSDFYWFNPYASSAPRQLFGILWGAGSAGDGSLKRGGDVVKTMYDPCPPGYQVMPIDMLDQVVNSNGGDQYGWYLTGTDGSIYFPYNGAAWAGGNFWMARGFVPNGDTAHYTTMWTSGHNNSNMAYCFDIYSKDVNRAGGGEIPSGGHILARGMGVRCVTIAQ